MISHESISGCYPDGTKYNIEINHALMREIMIVKQLKRLNKDQMKKFAEMVKA